MTNVLLGGTPAAAVSEEEGPKGLDAASPVGILHDLLREQREARAILLELSTAIDSLAERFTLRSVSEPAQSIPPVPTIPPSDKYQAYQEMIVRLGQAVHKVIPGNGKVLVISKGDDLLLRLPVSEARHFPQGPNGGYAGHHPLNSEAAISQLEALRSEGAEYLIIPQSSLWWLTYYSEFAGHLANRYRTIFREAETGAIFALGEGVGRADRQNGRSSSPFKVQLDELLRRLLPRNARVAVVSKGDSELTGFSSVSAEHFPQTPDGEYIGYHPADSLTAVAHLEELRDAGIEYLLIPKPSEWWLEYYAEFHQYLNSSCRLVTRQKHLGVLYTLNRHSDG